MTKLKKIGKLQLEQDLAFQHKFWRIERTAWGVFLLLLVLVALGFAGGTGPFNQAKASNDQIQVRYQPFVRQSANTDIYILIRDVRTDTAQLFLQRDFIDKYQIESITPQPSDEKSSTQFIVYEFGVAESTDDVKVSFLLKSAPRVIGNIDGGIGLAEDDLIKIDQWVYP